MSNPTLLRHRTHLVRSSTRDELVDLAGLVLREILEDRPISDSDSKVDTDLRRSAIGWPRWPGQSRHRTNP